MAWLWRVGEGEGELWDPRHATTPSLRSSCHEWIQQAPRGAAASVLSYLAWCCRGPPALGWGLVLGQEVGGSQLQQMRTVFGLFIYPVKSCLEGEGGLGSGWRCRIYSWWSQAVSPGEMLCAGGGISTALSLLVQYKLSCCGAAPFHEMPCCCRLHLDPGLI